MAKPETPKPIRGTQDMLGETAERFAHVVATFDRVRRLYGFRRVEVPVFEATAVFARSLGETTDVVSKEMYSFEDRGGESLTLRPEFTAGLCRAYLSEGWQQHAPLKLATHGPVFRYERPQKGRFRQFHQLDAEVIGAAEPQADVELIALADQLLHELGIADGVTLELNTLGDQPTRDAWRSALVGHFEAYRDALSEESLARLERNPLRILDSKDPRDRPVAESAPSIDTYLTTEAGAFFEAVTKGLDAAGVRWTRSARLVRGLDYYRHTAFEFTTDRLGAQGTVLGGGRYDGLIETLGGPHTPAVGWAAGIERLAMLVEAPVDHCEEIVILAESERAAAKATALLAYLRSTSQAVLASLDEVRRTNRQPAFSTSYKTSKAGFRKQFEKAQSSGTTVIVVRDDGEPLAQSMLLSFKAPRAERFNPLSMRAFLSALLFRGSSGNLTECTPDGFLADMRIDLRTLA